jgi:2'-5' RNA ligase
MKKLAGFLIIAAPLMAGAQTLRSPRNDPSAERPKEYSIWLVPSGADHDDLKKLISSLSAQYGTPDFEPHVTLVGLGVIAAADQNLIAGQVESLAKTICPFAMRLRGVGATADPFRSLFLKVEQTTQVMAAGRQGLDFYRQIQGQEPSSTSYFPHLSLLYGNLPPSDKERIIAGRLKAQKRLERSFTASKIQLWITTAKLPDWPDAWKENWRMVKEFPLGEGAVCPKP